MCRFKYAPEEDCQSIVWVDEARDCKCKEKRGDTLTIYVKGLTPKSYSNGIISIKYGPSVTDFWTPIGQLMTIEGELYSREICYDRECLSVFFFKIVACVCVDLVKVWKGSTSHHFHFYYLTCDKYNVFKLNCGNVLILQYHCFTLNQ